MAHSQSNRFKKAEDHPDVSYLKSDAVGKVLSKALGQLYKHQPSNPLHFLGNWLINYASLTKNKEISKKKAEETIRLKQKYENAIQDMIKQQEKSAEEAAKKFQKENDFRTKIESTLDVDDLLTEFANHLKEELDCTGVYIGILEKIKRPITDLDGEFAHVDDSAPDHIRYIAASAGHEFMIDKTLKEDEGEITYSIWKEEEAEVDKPESEDGDHEKVVEKKAKFAYVPDVVNNPKIKFFDVPKLGAYFATPLTYKSCLSESSFDTAVDDALDCRRRRADQELEREKKSEDNKTYREGEENPEEEEKVWEDIQEAPYVTTDIKLVVCVDTMGKDCEISEEKRNYVIQWVEFFKSQWERAEDESLRHDVSVYMKQHDLDLQNLQDKQGEWVENERVAIDERLADLEAGASEETKELETAIVLLNLYRDRLLEKYVVDQFYSYKEFKFLKYSRVIQLVLYYFGVPKAQIVEPGTNRLNWKLAKKALNDDFLNTLKHINPCGPKPPKPPAYAMTKKLQNDLSNISFDDVQHYSFPLSLLYSFLDQLLKVRILDVSNRRRDYNNKQEERENAIKLAEELAEKRKNALLDAKERHEKDEENLEEGVEKTPFNEAEFLAEFDERESNQVVEIPPEVVPDEDGDIGWDE
ncbi:unnamed protein product [Blepharisma stoltei]|uniref:Uncharacterized protein n=1 Tax=Blepharisma stoltei TaxID=1481888 RepID=A0AAU9IL06_9CILI|nr:unnamed protein product [Blepharisma stoltei]